MVRDYKPWLWVSFCLILLCVCVPGPEVIQFFSCSTQLSIKFIMLINVKMPTIVGILTFISMINTTYESLKVRKEFIFKFFSCYEHLILFV